MSMTANLILTISLLIKCNAPETVKHIYHSVIVSEKKDVALDEASLTHEMVSAGIVLPSVAIAQAKIESGLGKSRLGRDAKNFTHHNCKYVAGSDGVYARYNKYADCIRCYAHIQDHYLSKINGVYASDTKYINKIKQIK